VHAYASAGTYAVTLTVADAFGRHASRSRSITVGAGTNPTAAFVFSPTNPQVNQPVNFNGSASRAAAGRQIVQYTWDFGDGNIVTTSGPTASHSYGLPRTYTVTLRVRDNTGAESAISVTVPVTPTS
jgi:PKD repeat protein